MRLNQLEISGFKSFPERAELAFDTGVTAIVGPNGCGKSNVIDAITWVLGEQSARSLRGERMEDIIFSGSDARRPTAAAEVRLQLSQVTAALASLSRVVPGNGHAQGHVGQGHGNGHGNGNGTGQATDAASSERPGDGHGDEVNLVVTDAEDPLDDGPRIVRDVEVGRRLYRSGESEYLIDGRVCRLRDIQDLLMDSGVGVKAYAVIEQGKIGQILGARPLERRQLLEEAAGVTKYKSRRRAAELKLEAAQQNLTRVDDIVFEVEKQRSALKRQAAKARRYRRLREEIRRWEKVLFAHKSAALRRAIEAAQHSLDAARTREREAAAELSGVDSRHERSRIELAEAEQSATGARDAAHAHELQVGRRQQQIDFDKHQVSSLEAAATEGEATLQTLEARRSPLQAELTQQLQVRDRCAAGAAVADEHLKQAESDYTEAQRAIEGLEGDVEASRSEVFAAVNSATALKHVVDNAVDGRARIDAELAKLSSEASDVETEAQKVATEHNQVDTAVTRARQALETTRLARAERDAELGAARLERESHADQARTQEHALTSMAARLTSLEEFAAAREGYNDAARLVLSECDGAIAHLGSVADHLAMERQHERAVDACLDDLLQYVIVEHQRDALAGMELATTSGAGRCGFLVVETLPNENPVASPPVPSLTPLADLVRFEGPAAESVRRLLARRWFASSFDVAAAAACLTTEPIVTAEGVVFRGVSVLRGGGKHETLGILGTKGEINELRDQVTAGQDAVRRLNGEVTRCAAVASHAEAELKTLQADEHLHEKELLELELRVAQLDAEAERLYKKRGLIDNERRTAEEAGNNLDAKQVEAREAISCLEADQRAADERFMTAQRRLFEARESLDSLGHEVTEARAAQAALAERAAALGSDVKRLQDAARDLDQRVSARTADNRRTVDRGKALAASVATSERQLDEEVKRFDALQEQVRAADTRSADLRDEIDEQVGQVRAARERLEGVRDEVGRVAVTKATAVADHSNLSSACLESLQISLDQVEVEVDRIERDGIITPEIALIESVDDGSVSDAVSESDDDAGGNVGAPVGAGDEPSQPRPTVEIVIAQLREKVDRLGPVNMMAIDQFDELEQRYEFLTTQRTDLLDAIKATGEAIKRIDVTTSERFKDAFTAINEHFQGTFSTLFGGGRAGLVLLDESDLLESGVDIIAQPPGKRLQSIQLLSGGEKALTAMSLMFAIFKYRPSPFCLLDEIDAPLDDVNIGRFVDMLRGMQDYTQFVLVTHNRKTMEIADRLYGVTMEEPGVSKLISVRLS